MGSLQRVFWFNQPQINALLFSKPKMWKLQPDSKQTPPHLKPKNLRGFIPEKAHSFSCNDTGRDHSKANDVQTCQTYCINDIYM